MYIFSKERKSVKARKVLSLKRTSLIIPANVTNLTIKLLNACDAFVSAL